MRKHTKILVSVVAVICMIAAMMIPSFAADTGSLAVADGATEADGVFTLTLADGSITWTGLKDPVQDKNGVKQLGLKPSDASKLDSTYVEFKFNVEKAGEYELTLGFAADNTNRKANVIVNGDAANATALTVEADKGWDTQTNKLTVKLAAGDVTVRFVNDPAFDGSTVKALNVVSVEWKLTKEDAPETDAPETDAPETDAPETDAPETNAPETDAPNPDDGKEPAPPTGFAAIALAIAAIGSGAYVVSKRKH